MKKTLLRLLAIIVLAVLGVVARNLYPKSELPPVHEQVEEIANNDLDLSKGNSGMIMGENRWPMGDEFDENWIEYDECDTIGCPINFAYDYGLLYNGGYIGYRFEGQGPLSISLRYVKPDGTKYAMTNPDVYWSIVAFRTNTNDPTDTSHMYLYELKSFDPRKVGEEIAKFDCSNTDTFMDTFSIPSRCSILAMKYVFDLLRGNELQLILNNVPPSDYFTKKLNEFKQAIDEGTLMQIN